ncbi:MAG: hypothetical protein JO138_27905 [Acidobacteriaceae bacterium]|nr:hypothetical protein [Acidobacteriaceae bacterium]
MRLDRAALLFGAACCAATSQTGPVSPAEDAVRNWYQVVNNGSDQQHLADFGIIGDGPQPLERAYSSLAPTLRSRMSREEFLAGYRGLARLTLLQDHSMTGSSPDSERVLVEEERTMVLEGIPAVAWFEGLITVTKTSEGWKISELKDVKPEDIISTPIGGEMPWHTDPAAVAMASLHCEGAAGCKIKTKPLPQTTSTRPGKVTVQTPDGLYTVSMAKLHNGSWIVLETKQETGYVGK